MVTLRPVSEAGNSAELLGRIPPELMALANARQPWTSYVAYASGGEAVGVCAFKSAPNKEREVEIAYHTFPEFERRGHGVAMARLLWEIAASSGEVNQVIARTLKEENASVRICRRLNFAFAGEVVDPQDGPVWQWRSQPARPTARTAIVSRDVYGPDKTTRQWEFGPWCSCPVSVRVPTLRSDGLRFFATSEPFCGHALGLKVHLHV